MHLQEVKEHSHVLEELVQDLGAGGADISFFTHIHRFAVVCLHHGNGQG